MKSKSWLVIVMQAFGDVRHFHLARRTRVLFIVGAIMVTLAMIVFGFGYFTLRNERNSLQNQLTICRDRAVWLEEKLGKIAVEKLPGFAPVGIEDFQVTRTTKRGGVSIRFRILNTHPLETPFRGTMVMVAKNESIQPPVYLVKPEMTLRQGVPSAPANGIALEIENQKVVDTLLVSETEHPLKTLTVFIYASEGKLVLQKTMPLSDR